MANRSQDEDRVLALGVPTSGFGAKQKAAGSAAGATTGTGATKSLTPEQKAQSGAAEILAANQNRQLTVFPWEQPGNTAPTTTQPTPTTQAPTYSSGSSGGSSTSSKSTTAPLSTERALIGSVGNYDPAAYEAYTQALQALETARGQRPTYNDTYGDQLSALYAEITGREPFKYDLDGDPLYQQYRDMYMMQGQQAMMDTMGQAAALTGGYGSTYSQAVGQQQYNAYLQDLNAIVPDLYQNAYSRWSDEGDRMLSQYGMLSDLSDREYGLYRDQMSDYWTNVDYAQQLADLEYNRGLSEWEREYQLNEDKRVQQESNYNRLMQLMQIGYTPSADEISAAGMSEAEAAALQNYFKSQQSSGGGGGTGPTPVKWSDAGTAASDYLVDMFYHNDYINPGANHLTDFGNDNSMTREETEAMASSYLDVKGITGTEKTQILEAVMAGYGKSQEQLKDLWDLPEDYK